MSKISEQDVRHVALLSRLTFSDEEIHQYTHDLNSILDYVSALESVDTTGVEPTSHSLKITNVFRDDIVRDSLSNEDALANAPESEDAHFRVPKIIQG